MRRADFHPPSLLASFKFFSLIVFLFISISKYRPYMLFCRNSKKDVKLTRPKVNVVNPWNLT